MTVSCRSIFNCQLSIVNYPLKKVGKALDIGSKSEDLQGVFIFDGFEERPEENARTVSGFYILYPSFFIQPSMRRIIILP